jgi:mannose-6-phosphate isomerase-like protein (cupin superfamily)
MNKGIILPKNPRLEISFHYGIDEFYKFGLTMINVINDKYCKKLLILLPGQKHPAQYHKIKKESFFILYGTVNVKINNKNLSLKSGSLLTINPTEVHEFYSSKGAVIEELSTTSVKSDSYYIDNKINKNKSRKTFIYL